jgi:hypothetical protein
MNGIQIVPTAPTITSATTASATAGSSFSYQIIATTNPSSFSATGLPAGLTLNTSTGLITGKPTFSGTYSVMLTANSATGTTTVTLTLVVQDLATDTPAMPVWGLIAMAALLLVVATARAKPFTNRQAQ